METLVEIECSECNKVTQKRKAEINRQRKNGRKKFYCSRSCSGKGNKNTHLLEWANSDENKSFIKSMASNKKDEYTGFREYMRTINKRVIEGRFNSSDIDLSYLKEVWNNQSGKCVYTKVPLIHPERKSGNKNYQASLDRIDSSKGYIRGNIQFVSVTVNWLKNDCDENHLNEFFDIIRGCVGSTG
tara:strand:- start:22 stop:579 length:558 start_codon:yes stop_codon:yes gene_type:complete